MKNQSYQMFDTKKQIFDVETSNYSFASFMATVNQTNILDSSFYSKLSSKIIIYITNGVNMTPADSTGDTILEFLQPAPGKNQATILCDILGLDDNNKVAYIDINCIHGGTSTGSIKLRFNPSGSEFKLKDGSTMTGDIQAVSSGYGANAIGLNTSLCLLIERVSGTEVVIRKH